MHAKLTRDRKKLFTSRMQQMISSLERQNGMMKNRLKSLASSGEPRTSYDTDAVRTDLGSQILGNSKGSNTIPFQLHNNYPSAIAMSLIQALSSSAPSELRTSGSGSEQILNQHLNLNHVHVPQQTVIKSEYPTTTTIKLEVPQIPMAPDASRFQTFFSPASGIKSQLQPQSQSQQQSQSSQSQSDENPFLQHLGPLNRVRNDARQVSVSIPTFNSSQFTFSTPSFFEAL